MIGTILFATDLGPYTSQVLQHVITMAEQNSAKVCVLHVVDPVSALTHNLLSKTKSSAHSANYASVMNECIRDQVMESLEDEYIDGNSALDRVSHVSVMTGLPSETILEHSKKLGADLIVLGSHGHHHRPNNKTGSALGSVANNVLHQSAVPVYLVPLMKSSRIQSACNVQSL